jgi:hypothetical protein
MHTSMSQWTTYFLFLFPVGPREPEEHIQGGVVSDRFKKSAELKALLQHLACCGLKKYSPNPISIQHTSS